MNATQGGFLWGRMVSWAAIDNRRARRLPIGTQLSKLSHKRHVAACRGTRPPFLFGLPMVAEWPGVKGIRRWVAAFGLAMLILTFAKAPFGPHSLRDTLPALQEWLGGILSWILGHFRA